MQEVVRKERKYLLTPHSAAMLEARLLPIIRQDSHNGDRGYINRSLYFDTPYDRDLLQKRDSMDRRRKIRLRCYGSGESSAYLEIKQKDGDRQLKRSLKLPRVDAEELCRGNYAPLLIYDEPFAKECYALMTMYAYRPKTIVQYRRRAFIVPENDIRLTLDSDVVATECRFGLFDEPLAAYPVIDPGRIIFEVKYNNFLLSWVRELLNLVDSGELSVSKYALARSISHPAY